MFEIHLVCSLIQGKTVTASLHSFSVSESDSEQQIDSWKMTENDPISYQRTLTGQMTDISCRQELIT